MAESHTTGTTATQAKTRKPFFNKGGGDSFFPIQRKCACGEKEEDLSKKPDISSIQRKDMIQRNLSETLPVNEGEFGIDMADRTFAANNKTGMTGTIEFIPATTSPYSNEISLIQIDKVINANDGTRATPVAVAGAAGTNPLYTEDNALAGTQKDFITDAQHNSAGALRDTKLSPEYSFSTVNETAAGGCTGGNPLTHGFKRSNDPKDIKGVKMADCPGIPDNASNFDFDFETVAKGSDTNNVYGSIHWGFKVRAGAVNNEYANVKDAESATFDDSLARHQDFYTHEPLVLYFDFNRDTPNAAEAGKVNKEITDYLRKFPDVQLSISAFSDKRGSAVGNRELAGRRAESTAKVFIDKGIAATRINPFTIVGATDQFTRDATTNQDKEANRQGNRRVVVEFQHTSSTP